MCLNANYQIVPSLATGAPLIAARIFIYIHEKIIRNNEPIILNKSCESFELRHNLDIVHNCYHYKLKVQKDKTSEPCYCTLNAFKINPEHLCVICGFPIISQKNFEIMKTIYRIGGVDAVDSLLPQIGYTKRDTIR